MYNVASHLLLLEVVVDDSAVPVGEGLHRGGGEPGEGGVAGHLAGHAEGQPSLAWSRDGV